MKVLIINYNRLTLAKQLADWCAAHGLEPVFIDNNSTYQPLLEYYHSCPYLVMHMNRTWGHKVVWESYAQVLPRLGITGRYIVTDSDLDLSGVPADFLEVMNEGLDKYSTFGKCGLSLEINDLPDNEAVQKIKHGCEQRYWLTPLDEMYFNAPVDTTFALYRETARLYFHEAIRTNRPYTARHVPWYYTDLASLPADEQYYFKTANASSSGKARLL